MQIIDQAFQLSKTQARVTSEVGKIMSSSMAAMLDASMAFAKANAQSHMALASAVMSAKSPEAAAEAQRAFLQNSMQSAGAMATRIADTFVAAAKQCEGLATPSMEAATKSGAMPKTDAP